MLWMTLLIGVMILPNPTFFTYLPSFPPVHSRNRTAGGSRDTVRVPVVDHRLCRSSRSRSPGNHHSYTVEGENACPDAITCDPM